MSAPIDRKRYYRGIPTAPYDLLKELTIAMVVVLAVTLVAAVVLSSPDVPPVTLRSWAQADAVDFVTTATAELAGQSDVAQYGPPYNDNSASVQSLWFLNPQTWVGVHVPVNPPDDFVLQPLEQSAPTDSELTAALTQFNGSPSDQQQKWLANYTTALGDATVSAGAVSVKSGDYGPVPVLMDRMLRLAQSGGLDGLLLSSGHFYQTDFTRPLLFMDDGGYLSGLAGDQKLTGDQWGMMNETGRYPGQAWLWLFTMWYQVGPYNQDSGFLGVSGANADLAIVATVAVLSILLVLVPFIPGLRDLPRWIPIHKLIWGRYYRDRRST